jgi:hypothetical protein
MANKADEGNTKMTQSNQQNQNQHNQDNQWKKNYIKTKLFARLRTEEIKNRTSSSKKKY